MEGKFTGSCHCGKIAFIIEGKILNVVNCHCSICRKVNGGAFESYVIAPKEDFQLLRGEDLLSCYAMSERADKHFCSVCGAAIFNSHRKYQGVVIVHLGCLDEPEKFSVTANIYCESMLPWVAFATDIPSFEQGLKG